MPVIVHAPAYCVNAAAERYNIPPAVLYAVIKTENGKAGYGNRNANGTIDWGPMQINGFWFVGKRSPARKAFPMVSANEIKTNPCTNVTIGAWILSELIEHDRSIWVAVGHYHSYRPAESRRYRHVVYRWYKRILADWRKRFGYTETGEEIVSRSNR